MLITRPEAAAGATAAALAARGFTPVLAPLLRIETLAPSLPDPARVDAVVIASPRAAALPPAWHQRRLLAVGSASAAAARSSGFAAIDDAEGDAAALIALARARLPSGARLLLAAGRGQGAGLAAGLREAGFRVTRRAVYAATPLSALPEAARAALTEDRLHAALFFSAETARCFARTVRRAGLAGRLAGIIAISIGAPAAMALEGLAWRDMRIAARPNQEAMLALLA